MTEQAGQAGLFVDVLSIFPEAIEHYVSTSILGRARASGHIAVRVVDLRIGATDVHRSVDDAPFGGGAGMVLAPEPVFNAFELAKPRRPVILLSPAGKTFDQARARSLAALGGFSLLCGRYEGIDERIVSELVDEEISIGDYVLAGGELAALVVLEAVARLVPGVLGNDASHLEESFSEGLLEYPQYTRPAEFRGLSVPEVLRSGDHRRVAAWRHAAALYRTLVRRPDLIAARGGLSEAEVRQLSDEGYPLAAELAGTPERLAGQPEAAEEREEP
jgi:tRNA (guanine37-N1)-methyltransferase